MSRFDNKPQNTFFKTWTKKIELAENLVFHQTKIWWQNFFLQKWQNSKAAKNLWFRFCWLIIFCSSEGQPATNGWVQLRVIPFFKCLHWQGFYNANVPEMTQKLAHHKIITILFLSLETKKHLFFILLIVVLLVFMWRQRGLLLICCVFCYFPLCVSHQNFLTVFNFGK